MNKAKQFLIDNSFEFSEAVDNGYGIIMDEDEILEWMQKYAESEVKNLALPQVSKCEDVEREASCKHSDWIDLYYSSGDIYGRYCSDCGEFFE